MNGVGLIVYGSYFSSGNGFTIECTYRQFTRQSKASILW